MDKETDRFVKIRIDDGIAAIIMDRPPLNVLHIPMLEQLHEALNSIQQGGETRALILQAEGKMFSAGVDVADHTPDKVGEMIPLFNQVCQTLLDFPVPTIAAAGGHALGGGCELVLCCDLAVMAEGAKIGQPEIQLAAFAPAAAVRLPALVGYRAAADMLFTGRSLEAREALTIGLVNAVLPREEVESWAVERGTQMAAMSGAAQRLNKKALRLGTAKGESAFSEIEKLYLSGLMNTEDAEEGLKAFLDKRPPVWKHK